MKNSWFGPEPWGNICKHIEKIDTPVGERAGYRCEACGVKGHDRQGSGGGVPLDALYLADRLLVNYTNSSRHDFVVRHCEADG